MKSRVTGRWTLLEGALDSVQSEVGDDTGACGLTTTDATDVAYFLTLAFSSSNQFVTIISCDWAPGL